MSEAVLLALVSAIPPTVAAIVAVWISHEKQGKKIQEIHVLVNSRLQAALEEIRMLKTKKKAR